ncbi:MAG TPA: ribosome small subunit-dependent GTPase A, partial [Gaiellaceae bacterium]|nr:ribosome small subunit-dependent GTPase A [Gaiellaceae bacterium]
LIPARVAVRHHGPCELLSEQGPLGGLPAGHLADADLPAVGDWVAARPLRGERKALVEAVLPRRTAFTRKEAWRRTVEQVVAANVDTVFLMSDLGPDLNVRRLERYLVGAWESGARPAIVLTKADLEADRADAVLAVEAVAFGVPVHVVSAVTGEGLGALGAYLGRGRTVALLGSSGVGKSTLVNRLAGREVLATRELRADGRGRHTTTHRELVLLPGGGLLLDTPGMRELQLWAGEEALDGAFEDVTAFAGVCRFPDCAHDHEPGCAVKAALADGSLPAERWESYRKLQRELRSLEVRRSKRLQAEERRRWRAVERSFRRRG